MKIHKHLVLGFSTMCLIALLLAACKSPATPTPTSTSTPTSVPTPTPSPTPSPVDAVTEGDTLLRRSDFDGAAAAYQRAIAIDESYGPAYVGLSQVYLWRDVSNDKALAQAQKAVELAPDSAVAYAVLAQAQMAQSATVEAVEAAERAVELDPQSAFAHAKLTSAYLLDRQYDLAQQAAEQAFSLDPELAHVYYALGRFYEETVDFARARAAYEQAAILEPEFVGWQTALGRLWMQSERYEEATSVFEQVLELASDHVPALLSLAYVESARKDYAAAEAQIEQAIALAPEEPDAYVTWGYLYLEQEEYDEALEQFNKALELDPENYYAQFAIGETYLQQSECEQAELQFQELNTAYPRFAATRIGRGYAEFCAGDDRKALTHFREAAKVEPYNSGAQVGLGKGYTFQERWEEGRDAYLEALRLTPAPANVHFNLGHWFWSQDMVEETEAEFRVALSMNPYLQDVYLSLGDLLRVQERESEALEVVEEAVALDAEDLDAQRLLGIIYYSKEDAEEAVDVLEQVLEEDPEDVLSYIYLGLAYRDLGDYRQAKKELETFLTLAGDYYGEDVTNRLGFLISALEQDYELSEEKAIADIEEAFEAISGQVPEDIQVEDLEKKGEEEGGRTLVITLAGRAADLEEESLFTQIKVTAYLAALIGPRIDPPITNGLLIRVDQWGETLLTIRADLPALRQFADVLANFDEFFEMLEFSLGETSESASIEEIKRDVADLRELEVQQAVPYQTLAQADVRERLTNSIDEQVRDSLERDESLLTSLGVITPELDLEDVWVNLYSEQIAGFYAPEEKTLYVVEQEEQTASDQAVLAHEYAHALQDQAFGLDRFDDPDLNDDQQLAFEALIEGDATLTAILYTEENISTVDRLDAASKSGKLEHEALDATPFFIRELSLFPYSAGLDFVVALYQRDDSWEEVNNAFTTPPQSTEQILHPERYWDGDTPEEVTLPNIGIGLGDTWHETGSNVLGELGIKLTLAEHVGPAAAMQAAEGWGGDRYLVLQNETQEASAVVIQTIWDDQDESDEFWTLCQVAMAHRTGYTQTVETLIGELESRWWIGETDYVYVAQEDRYVTIVIGPGRDDVEQIVAQLP